MPALDDEVEKAEEEGVRFEFLTSAGGGRARRATASTSPAAAWNWATSTRAAGPGRSRWRARSSPCGATRSSRPSWRSPTTPSCPAEFVDEERQAEDRRGHLRAGRRRLRRRRLRHRARRRSPRPRTPAAKRPGPSTASSGRGRAEEDDSARSAAIGEGFDGSCLQPSCRVDVPELSLDERLKSLDVEETGTLDLAAVRGRGRPLLQLRLRGRQLVRPGAGADRPGRRGQDVPAGHRRRGLLLRGRQQRARCWATARWCWRCEVPQAAAGTRSAFIKFALRKSIDFPVVNCAAAVTSDERRGQVGAHLPELGLRGAHQGDRGRGATWWARRIDQATAEQAADAGMDGTVAAPQQPLQDPDSPDAGQAGDPGLRRPERTRPGVRGVERQRPADG